VSLSPSACISVIVAQGVGLLDKCELIVVTGKGGVGRTTMAAALAEIGAASGRRTVLCEVSGQSAVPQAYGNRPAIGGKETTLGPNLAATTIDPDEALREWIRAQAGPAVGRALGASRSFAQFVAAAPGARELVTITKAWELGPGRRWGRGKSEHDLVVFEAPASGHGAAMLSSPRTFAQIAGRGPISDQAERVWELVTDLERTKLVAVATLAELPVSETVELDGWLNAELGRGLDLVICNRTIGGGYTDKELARLGKVAAHHHSLEAAVTSAQLQTARYKTEQTHRTELTLGLSSGCELAMVTEGNPKDSQLDLIHSAVNQIESQLQQD